MLFVYIAIAFFGISAVHAFRHMTFVKFTSKFTSNLTRSESGRLRFLWFFHMSPRLISLHRCSITFMLGSLSG